MSYLSIHMLFNTSAKCVNPIYLLYSILLSILNQTVLELDL